MSRTIKFSGYFILLFGLFIGSSFLLESCKGKGGDADLYEESDDTEYSSDEEIYDEYFESEEEASRAGVEVQDVGSSEADPEYQATEQDVTDYVEDFTFEATEEEKKAIDAGESIKPERTTTLSSSTSSAGGSYLVVAGSYLVRDNADNMVSKLSKMGYSGAEVIKFDEGKYHSVTAGRYESRSKADQIASALKTKGIDCYVHTRK